MICRLTLRCQFNEPKRLKWRVKGKLANCSLNTYFTSLTSTNVGRLINGGQCVYAALQRSEVNRTPLADKISAWSIKRLNYLGENIVYIVFDICFSWLSCSGTFKTDSLYSCIYAV